MTCLCGKPVLAKGQCTSCYEKAWRRNNPEKAAAKRRKWYVSNHEKAKKVSREKMANRRKQRSPSEKLRAAEWNRVWRLQNAEKLFALRLKKNGWTLERWKNLLEEQRGLCALCQKPFTKKHPPCADHKHGDTPKPRAVIHRNCNSAIGLLQDDPEMCERAATYLRFWGGIE